MSRDAMFASAVRRDAIEADATARSRRWARHRLEVMGSLALVAMWAAIALGIVAVHTSHWRSELLTTGTRTTGTVVTVDHYTGRTGGGDDVTIAVSEPAFRFIVDAHTGEYRTGEPVLVMYDPRHVRHARTLRHAAGNEPLTNVAGVGSVIAGLGAAVSSFSTFATAIIAVLLRGGLRRSSVNALGYADLGRGDKRAVMRFEDTGPTVWSCHLQHRKASPGTALVAGDGHWRVVAWPGITRPVLVRRAWTPLGRRLWSRALQRSAQQAATAGRRRRR